MNGEADWVNYGIDLINQKCQELGVESFPKYEISSVSKKNLDNALELAQAFLAEWRRIKDNKEQIDDPENPDVKIEKWKYRSKIEGEFKIEGRWDEWGKGDKKKKGMRDYIFFTGSAYKSLNGTQYLRLPFQTAASFMNNVMSRDDGVRVEYGGKLHNVRIGSDVVSCYCISIQEEEVEE